MGPNLITCWQCGRKVDVTHTINALEKHNVRVAVTTLIKIVEGKHLTEQDERNLATTIKNNIIVPYDECGTCRQKLY